MLKKGFTKSNGRPENPALSQAKIQAAIKKSIDDAHHKGVKFAILCAKLFSYMVLSDKFGFSHDDLERFRQEFDSLGDSMFENYFSIEDILTVCLDEYKVTFTLEELQLIDPTFNNFVRAPEENQEKEKSNDIIDGSDN